MLIPTILVRLLSPASTIAKILPDLNSSSLLSLVQVCDGGCNVLLNKQKIYAIKDKEVVIEGKRNHRNGLWDIIIPSHPHDKTSVQTINYTTI